MWSPAILAIAIASCARAFTSTEVQSFLSPMRIKDITVATSNNNHCTTKLTSLFMGKRKKLSMKERRKQRAKRQPGFKADRRLIEDLPPVDAWEKAQPTGVTTASNDEKEDGVANESEEIAAKASALVQSQRKSVDCLTFIRKRVEKSFLMSDAVKSLREQGYFVHDGFLSSDEDEDEVQAYGDYLLSDMLHESSDMLLNDKLERDIARLGDGEYFARIVGGKAYVNCPRLTEYVVSLTRHLPPMINEEIELTEDGAMPRLDSTASMGVLRLYDRKSRLGAETLLINPGTGNYNNEDRPFSTVCVSEGIENDTRRLTAMLFLSSKNWDASACGGGVTIEQGERLDAIRDRIILIRSDVCSHRQEPWIGEDEAGLDVASCVIVHFVKARK